jgi:hypothetical protein
MAEEETSTWSCSRTRLDTEDLAVAVPTDLDPPNMPE